MMGPVGVVRVWLAHAPRWRLVRIGDPVSISLTQWKRNRGHDPVIIHGPMWQFECGWCDFMGDCWDTAAEADDEADNHVCTVTIEMSTLPAIP